MRFYIYRCSSRSPEGARYYLGCLSLNLLNSIYYRAAPTSAAAAGNMPSRAAIEHLRYDYCPVDLSEVDESSTPRQRR